MAVFMIIKSRILYKFQKKGLYFDLINAKIRMNPIINHPTR